MFCLEDVKDLVPDVLRHRLVLTYEALAEGITPDHVIQPNHAANPGAREATGEPMSKWRQALEPGVGMI